MVSPSTLPTCARLTTPRSPPWIRLHASPVCTRASVANSGATESQEDIDTAAAVVRALKAQKPQVFTLENVWQYRTFQAFTDDYRCARRYGLLLDV